MQTTLKVLALPRYDSHGASSRVRFFDQYSYLKPHNISVTFSPLLNHKYLSEIYQRKQPSLWNIMKAYLSRFFFLIFNGQKFDLIWVEKEFFPYAPTFIEVFLMKWLPKVLTDYDDAIHLNYCNKGMLWRNKIETIMFHSSQVIAGSPELLEIAKKSTKKSLNCHWIPSSVKSKPINPHNKRKKKTIKVGWIGSPSTEKYLLLLENVFNSFREDSRIQFIFMGTQHTKLTSQLHIETRKWSLEAQNNLLNEIDIGIMPLSDTPWERCKCSYKLLLYMASSVPVIASPVGMNKSIVFEGKNGFLPETNQDWILCLKKFLNMDPGQLKTMGLHGAQIVERDFTYSVTSNKLKAIFFAAHEGAS